MELTVLLQLNARSMKKLIMIINCLITFYSAIQAQDLLAPEVIASAGGHSEKGGYHISWTLGETAVATYEMGDMLITEGFQQPFDKDVGIHPNEMNWNISVFPNPVESELRIGFDIPSQKDYLIEIHDVTGRVFLQELHRNVNPGDIITLNTSHYMNGVYLLKVYTLDQQQVQVTRILKL